MEQKKKPLESRLKIPRAYMDQGGDGVLCNQAIK